MKSKAKKQTTAVKKTRKIEKASEADGGSYEVLHRSLLKPFELNPRTIDPVAFRRLVESVRRSDGLIQPPVWNRRSGNVVAGHQRLKALDQVRGTEDYELTVCVVDLSEAEEIETNIRLNSPLLSGEYDVSLLDQLLERSDVDLEYTGVDMSLLESLHVEQGLDLPEWALAPEDREADEALAEEGMEDVLAETLDDVDAAEIDAEEEERLNEMKRRKEHFKLQEGFNHQTGLSFRIVFPSNGTCSAFLKKLGKAVVSTATGDYVDGMVLAEILSDPKVVPFEKLKQELQQVLKDERPGKLKDYKLGDKEKKKTKKRS